MNHACSIACRGLQAARRAGGLAPKACPSTPPPRAGSGKLQRAAREAMEMQVGRWGAMPGGSPCVGSLAGGAGPARREAAPGSPLAFPLEGGRALTPQALRGEEPVDRHEPVAEEDSPQSTTTPPPTPGQRPANRRKKTTPTPTKWE